MIKFLFHILKLLYNLIKKLQNFFIFTIKIKNEQNTQKTVKNIQVQILTFCIYSKVKADQKVNFKKHPNF